MSTEQRTTRCRAGRTVKAGDVVAGARFGRYPDLVIATVLKVMPSGAVRVRVDTGSGGHRPSPGEVLLIPLGRFVRIQES